MHTVKKITDPRTQGQYSINKKDLKVLKDYYKRFKRTQTEDFDVIDKVINKLLIILIFRKSQKPRNLYFQVQLGISICHQNQVRTASIQ